MMKMKKKTQVRANNVGKESSSKAHGLPIDQSSSNPITLLGADLATDIVNIMRTVEAYRTPRPASGTRELLEIARVIQWHKSPSRRTFCEPGGLRGEGSSRIVLAQAEDSYRRTTWWTCLSGKVFSGSH